MQDYSNITNFSSWMRLVERQINQLNINTQNIPIPDTASDNELIQNSLQAYITLLNQNTIDIAKLKNKEQAQDYGEQIDNIQKQIDELQQGGLNMAEAIEHLKQISETNRKLLAYLKDSAAISYMDTKKAVIEFTKTTYKYPSDTIGFLLNVSTDIAVANKSVVFLSLENSRESFISTQWQLKQNQVQLGESTPLKNSRYLRLYRHKLPIKLMIKANVSQNYKTVAVTNRVLLTFEKG